MRRDGSRPRLASPAADGEPNSPASCRGQHHSTQGPFPEPAIEEEAFIFSVVAQASIRRTARRAAKPTPAIQSAADAPRVVEGTPLISWREFASSPLGRRSSQAGQPSSQRNRRRERDNGAFSGTPVSATTADAPRRGTCRSICKMRERKLSITASFPDSVDRTETAVETLGSKRNLMVKKSD